MSSTQGRPGLCPGPARAERPLDPVLKFAMRLKLYRAADTAEAMAQVRAELGPTR